MVYEDMNLEEVINYINIEFLVFRYGFLVFKILTPVISMLKRHSKTYKTTTEKLLFI
ncbi:hypothetical protein [Clostridium sartagoforme]|uniref:hypothetical protein n=1 Tax=Clostridium sartagoforme TaxID=84031 RepID=UPI0012FAAEAE|nr:hypothetical protein [Clostridium sartagoforme]